MKNKGYALIVTIYVVIVFAVVGITVAAFIASESIANALALSGLKAVHVAEGGAEYILVNDLVSDNDWSDNNGQTYSNISLGEGVFDAAIRSSSEGSCTVEVTGYINRGNPISGIARRVRIEVAKDVNLALINAVAAIGGRINMNNTTGSINGGDLVSTDDVVVAMGGNYGVSSYESISAPFIDWIQYKNLAVSQGNYYGGDLTLSNVTKNGIIFVGGNVRIDDDVTINGSLIVQGKINMNNTERLYISSEAYYPALASAVLVTGESAMINGTHLEDSYINGLIYSAGNITFNVIDNVTVVGAMLSEGRISMVNGVNFNLTYDPRVQYTAFMNNSSDMRITKWTNL